MQRPDEADFRGWRFETFEERLALSAQPIADFWIDPLAESIVEPSSAFVEPLAIAGGTGASGVAAARQQFGLRGGKQTIAIIDSGIAYDHVALGGGFGGSHRVVGGWDFAENDANPYDDGPAGFHGTHVAGIVGANDRRYSGLAPDVDLVALRVFDDQGGSSFVWVEQALAWVHQHRFDFANPITTVNLSLGTEWNANSLPGWGTFEDELKQLADDGIFVAVAAGNSFQTMNTVGLSYPAVSPYVVPVASVDALGNLSRFSQRDSRVLAAPGEKIKSTLPDAFYGGDGNKNDWGPSSGTSMASPYVAGASVLVREAMTNLGYSQITQGTIADLFRRTADTIYDTVTHANYQRINVERALTTLIGGDDHGSTAAAATSLGQLATALQVSGTIGSTSDHDSFQFVAARSGQVTLTLSGPAHLAAAWKEPAGGRIDGNRLTLDVTAGQTYTVGVSGGGVTIGKYNVAMQLVAAAVSTPPVVSPPPTPQAMAANLGAIEQRRIDGITVAGNGQWFQVTASRSGRFTAEAIFAHAGGNIDLEIYDARQRLIGVSRGTGNVERIDVEVAAGNKLLVRLRGTNRGVDLRLTNLVTIVGSHVTAHGTSAADEIRWHGGAQPQLSVNGVSYRVAASSQIFIDGLGGSDALVASGASSGRVTATNVEYAKGAVLTSSSVFGPVLPPVFRPASVIPTPQLRELAFAIMGSESELELARRRRLSSEANEAIVDAAFERIGQE